MGPKNAESFSEGHSSPVLSRELGAAHWGSGIFFQRLMTGDETWVYHRDPESKMESMQWKDKTSPTPKKCRVEKPSGKVMATVFWVEKGLLLLEFMPQKSTITRQTYANTITALREAIKEKRWGKISAGMLLLHDNTPVGNVGSNS